MTRAYRIPEAARPMPVKRLTREAVKLHLIGRSNGDDGDVRAALMERFGGGRAVAVGTKKAPGPLYSVSNDVWAALAVAVAWADGAR